jgi:hypothetical protein
MSITGCLRKCHTSVCTTEVTIDQIGLFGHMQLGLFCSYFPNRLRNQTTLPIALLYFDEDDVGFFMD